MYGLGCVEQAPLPNAQQETWTQASLYMAFSRLCVLQVLFKSNNVKWNAVLTYLSAA